MTAVRVRFAPSPTGEPHVGNIRTAIFAWLFARGRDGTFLVRVEDTDRAREVEGAIESILGSLRWLGLDWDEGPDIGGPYGPYHQSERTERGDYRIAANRLISSGHAYYCICPAERLAEVREAQRREGNPPGYDRRCRSRHQAELATSMGDEPAPVVRFAAPTSGETTVSDIVRGNVTFDNVVMDDFVLLKSDGFPTYHLANVVDDHAMRISHVIRADEWLPSLPRHWLIYDALGYPRPEFAHVPVILAPDRSKLSKRHGATSITEFRTGGYLPDAMINFLSLLGWSLDDKTEILSRTELIENFSLERVSRSPAVFDTDKLDWMNGLYIRESDTASLADSLRAYWAESPPGEFDREPDSMTLGRALPLISDRIKRLSEAAGMVGFLFTERLEYEDSDLVTRGLDTDSALSALTACHGALSRLESFDSEAIEARLRALASEMELKLGPLLGPLRVAVTGRRVSPPLFESMELLGKTLTLRRAQDAMSRLESASRNQP